MEQHGSYTYSTIGICHAQCEIDIAPPARYGPSDQSGILLRLCYSNERASIPKSIPLLMNKTWTHQVHSFWGGLLLKVIGCKDSTLFLSFKSLKNDREWLWRIFKPVLSSGGAWHNFHTDKRDAYGTVRPVLSDQSKKALKKYQIGGPGSSIWVCMIWCPGVFWAHKYIVLCSLLLSSQFSAL